jgi:hypothetical protein
VLASESPLLPHYPLPPCSSPINSISQHTCPHDFLPWRVVPSAENALLAGTVWRESGEGTIQVIKYGQLLKVLAGRKMGQSWGE